MEFLPSFSSVVVLEGAFIFQSAVGGGHGWVGGWLLVVVVLQLGVFIFKLRRGAPLVLMWGFHKKIMRWGHPPPPLAKTLQKGAIMQLFKSRP